MSRAFDYGVLIEGIPNDAQCECEDCSWVGPFAALGEIETCSLTPGDPSPAGRGPECNTLAYVVPSKPDPKTREGQLELLRDVVEAKLAFWSALGALETALTGEAGFTDMANDKVIEEIDDLAAAAPERPRAVIGEQHLSRIIWWATKEFPPEPMHTRPPVERLVSVTLPGDEARVFYAFEWVDTHGLWFCDVYSTESMRDAWVARCADHGATRIVIYEVVCSSGMDIDEARDFVRDNA